MRWRSGEPNRISFSCEMHRDRVQLNGMILPSPFVRVVLGECGPNDPDRDAGGRLPARLSVAVPDVLVTVHYSNLVLEPVPPLEGQIRYPAISLGEVFGELAIRDLKINGLDKPDEAMAQPVAVLKPVLDFDILYQRSALICLIGCLPR